MLDDLNPLYVYEAKMSLFIRISQTRQGAERLVESRLLQVLSQCEFIDAKPEADRGLLGEYILYEERKYSNFICKIDQLSFQVRCNGITSSSSPLSN